MQKKNQAALISPVVDFLGLGGLSIIVLFCFSAFVPNSFLYNSSVLYMTFLLSFLINYPHFAASYLLFYQHAFVKMLDIKQDPFQLARYWLAVAIVPAVLVYVFAKSVLQNDLILLGYTANVMFFFVGWHYVKQGYGILMMLNALKGCYFSHFEKNVFLINSYAVWIFSYLLVNEAIRDKEIFSIPYSTFALPNWALVLSSFIVGALFLTSTLIMVYRYFTNKVMPSANGMTAYVCASYVWIMLSSMGIQTIYVYVVPAFHSLQYMVVVWRLKYGEERADSGGTAAATPALLGKVHLFFIASTIVGGAIFNWIPRFLDASVQYNELLYGATLFMFMFHIFINIHHYFIDSAIWRRDNPQFRDYIFQSIKNDN